MEIRKATIDDCHNYFFLVNDPLVRENSIHQEEINYEDHIIWFESRLRSDKVLMLVVEENHDFLGQVRFEQSITDQNWYIDYSLVASFRGKGLARKMVDLAINFLYSNTISSNTYLMADVKSSNLASIKVFQKLGFTQTKLNNSLFRFQTLGRTIK